MKKIILGIILLVFGGISIGLFFMPTVENSMTYNGIYRDMGLDNKNIEFKEQPTDPSIGSSKNRSDENESTYIKVPVKDIDLKGLKKKNKDVHAFIYIPDTVIKYPVMQSDGDFYLHHDFNKKQSYHGCIYMRTEDGDSPMVIYGHNMKDGTMFAGIRKYADSSFQKSHPYMYLYTDDGWNVYKFVSFSVISSDSYIPERGDLYLLTCQGENNRFMTQWKKILTAD